MQSETDLGHLVGERYLLLDSIGQGGMADVNLARDQRDGHLVAVKWLARSRRSDAAYRARLLLEAELLAQVRPASSLSMCADCDLNTLCGGGCRSENHLHTGNADQPLCGEWRKQACYELLAEDLPDALEWPVEHLIAEARFRGIETTPTL